jgi:transcriptional regulator with GAF, ATPase, and Fis domain
MLHTLWNLAGSDEAGDIVSHLQSLKDKIQAELRLSRYEQWYALSIYPIHSGNECLGYIMIMQDITSIKNLETQLQAQNDALEEANRQLSRDAHMAGILEAEKQRLQVQEKVQSEILKQIEQAITDIGTMRTFYKDTGQFCRDDAAELAERLRSIHKDVRKSIGAISGRSGAYD